MSIPDMGKLQIYMRKVLVKGFMWKYQEKIRNKIKSKFCKAFQGRCCDNFIGLYFPPKIYREFLSKWNIVVTWCTTKQSHAPKTTKAKTMEMVLLPFSK